jgi:hypothetical protein
LSTVVGLNVAINLRPWRRPEFHRVADKVSAFLGRAYVNRSDRVLLFVARHGSTRQTRVPVKLAFVGVA